MEAFTGKVWVLGDDIDTDIIIPTEYLALKTIDDMKQYGFSPLRPELAGQIQKGDIIVAGKNFGCGSSREQAPEIIKALGVQCVIAKSFARIFFRNSINNGLLLIEQPDLHDNVKEGDEVTVVMNPNCSVCWGSCQGVIGENEVLISTGTRNFKGRAGHPSSKVYLGSAATVTASAIAGEIATADRV